MKRKILKLLMTLCLLTVPVMATDTSILADEFNDWHYIYEEKVDGTLDFLGVYDPDRPDEEEEDGIFEYETFEIPAEIDGKKVTSIGKEAFKCARKLKSVTIPDSITYIDEQAFSSCESLSTIIIPDSVTYIGKEAFTCCYGLRSVVIPENVTHIGEEAFSSCKNLSTITIPKNVNEIGSIAFFGCEGLTEIIVEEENATYMSEDGILYSKDKTVMYTYPAGKNGPFSIPDGVKEIQGAFASCKSLEEINIPDSVTVIGDYTFASCSGLKAVAIPNTVTVIGEYAFNHCNELSEVVIPSSVTDINRSAFASCTELKVVTISDGVKQMGAGVFNACKMLTEITIPDSVISMGGGIFHGCTNLKTVVLSNNLEEIEREMFEDCENLTNLIIPEGVTAIGVGAFQCCDSLNNVVIPKTVESIDNVAFSACSSLTDVYYTGNKKQWKRIEFGNSNKKVKNARIHYGTSLLVELAENQYTYTGQALTPQVVVKNLQGQVIDASRYEVAYKNNKKAGYASVIVKGMDEEIGTQSVYFTICPKETSVSKVIGKKKALSVKWKKVSKQADGYEVWYSMKPAKMKKGGTITVKGNKKTSHTIKNLKAKSTYYVKVRTYKNVKVEGKSEKLYSEWSEIKTVKTKK